MTTPEPTIRFSLFSDLHYKKGMYASTVEDMERILQRARKEQAAFVIQAGDFSNDYVHSPELTRRYLENPEGLPVYGVYGNHELETEENTMDRVTPLLTNRADQVTFGTKDGKIGDGSVAYYYFDQNGFRFIFLDSNYSLNPKTGLYEHNVENSWGAPAGNILEGSLSPEEFDWLSEVLQDAAEKGLSCIVTSHVSYSEVWKSAPDTKEIRALFNKANETKKGTVLLAINGHYHTDHFAVRDNILFLDVNTARNGWWQAEQVAHYADDKTFLFTDYDSDGKPVSQYPRKLNTLRMSDQTWYFEDPLDAVVEVSKDGKITVEGSETRWLFDIGPSNPTDGAWPKISSSTTKLCI